MTPKIDPAEKPGVPIAMVIFGVTGDLTRRKLIPALYQLALEDHLPDDLFIIGFARRDWDNKIMREKLKEGVKEFSRTDPINNKILDGLLNCMYYIKSSFEEEAGYQELNKLLENLNATNKLFYLSTPPTAYETIVEQLGEVGLGKNNNGWSRIVIEKPYGYDPESALSLDSTVHRIFHEDQVYRIDHYLGKETVQNILVFRFANGIFEPLWNRRYIESVQITVAESLGVGTRAGYYDSTGVIRDMFQNHIIQLITLTAMEAPVSFTADDVRDEKVKVLKALRPLRGVEANEKTFRAQYVAGSIDGKRVLGYKDEPNVPSDSVTETLLGMRLEIDNWRWADVPFYILSGKRLPRRITEIAIRFKQVPLSLFGWKNLAGDAPNTLVLNIQPEEKITLSFGAKKPGPINQIAPVKMNFSYSETFGVDPPLAYERLLLDSMNGDAILFTRSDEVHAAWACTADILEAWESEKVKNLPVYEAGTWGPPLINEFIEDVGGEWRNLDEE